MEKSKCMVGILYCKMGAQSWEGENGHEIKFLISHQFTRFTQRIQLQNDLLTKWIMVSD